MQLKFLPIVALAAQAFAAKSTILDSMKEIETTTNELKAAVTGWSGKFLNVFPILEKSGALLIDIKKGERVAEDSAVLTQEETFFVAQATLAMSATVASTIDAVIAAKPKFDNIFTSPSILVNLKVERDATEEFSEAVIEKIPKEFQEAAKSIVAQIDASFAKGIAAYE